MNFSDITPQLVRAAQGSLVKGEQKLRQSCGTLATQMEADAKRRGPLSFWGRSSNTDEVTQSQIVDPAIIALIGRLAQKKLSPVTPHAGLQHTYGYLFSEIETPYGMKRDRWTETTLENALDIP